LTIPEAAQQTGLSPRYVRRLVDERKVASAKARPPSRRPRLAAGVPDLPGGQGGVPMTSPYADDPHKQIVFQAPRLDFPPRREVPSDPRDEVVDVDDPALSEGFYVHEGSVFERRRYAHPEWDFQVACDDGTAIAIRLVADLD